MNGAMAASSSRRKTRMHPTLDGLLNSTPYQQLPESIKATMTEREYLFLTDAQKAVLEQSETEPETYL